MLFHDSTISTIDDLVEYESELRAVAAAEGIDLETKLRLAQREVGVELLAASALPDATSGPSRLAPFAATAVSSRTVFTLDQVVVTDGLRLWHIFHTLAILFRDAYNRRLNDKYLPKWKEYRELAQIAAGQYLAIGVALVLAPLPAPGAPTMEIVSGGALPAGNYFVRTTWINAAGQESAPSLATAKALAAGQQLRVSPATPPSQATGWFPYVGNEAGQEQRQSSAALALTDSWTMPASGLVAGAVPPEGQEPDLLRPLPRTLQRG